MKHLTYKQKLGGLIATGALLSQVVMPVAALAQTIQENGAQSVNGIVQTNSNTQTVVQTNDFDVDTDVNITQWTGGGTANFNTNGDVTNLSGDATAAVEIVTVGNSNEAIVSGEEEMGGSDAVIHNNGALSVNTVSQTNSHDASLFQDNDFWGEFDVNLNQGTGDGDASFNTNGDTLVDSGNVMADVGIGTLVNRNVGFVGGGSVVSLQNGVGNDIGENGALSVNSITETNSHTVLASQVNDADVDADVNMTQWSGGLTGTFNTNGSTRVRSGDVTGLVGIETIGNLNVAALGSDGMLEHAPSMIHNNGALSLNFITEANTHAASLFQTNDELDVDADATLNQGTGDADASFNTGSDIGDVVLVDTGNTGAGVGILTEGNSNVAALGMSLPGGWELDLGWDWSGLMGWFH